MRCPWCQNGADSAVNTAMPNDLTIRPISAVRAAGGSAEDPRAAVPFPPETVANPAGSRTPIVNPSLRLDPALGLIVIEFRNRAGVITTSVPSEQQLQAYQRWDVTHFGPTPDGAPKTSADQPKVHDPPAKEQSEDT